MDLQYDSRTAELLIEITFKKYAPEINCIFVNISSTISVTI